MILNNRKIIENWNYVGLFVLLFGLLRYFFYYFILKNNSIWDAFWVCHITSILAGIIIFYRDKFFISGILVWIILGPLLVVFLNTKEALSLTGFHHITTVLALPLMFFYYKEIWVPEGFVFGLVSFYAYMAITANLSNGEINLLNGIPLWAGLFLTIVSLLILFQSKFLKNKN